MNGVRQGWRVAKRELRERSRSRAFLASLAIMVIAVVGVIALPALLDTSGGTKDVGVTGPTPATLTATINGQGNAVGTKIRVHNYETVTEGERAVRAGKQARVAATRRRATQGRRHGSHPDQRRPGTRRNLRDHRHAAGRPARPRPRDQRRTRTGRGTLP